ncbi:hypothetical protein ZOSMA_12G00130 [Zostera marina]|uniref:Uncharacterized protein n=1 Tax=Zostera marina TaxID=29655 RepID=A0A0K9PZH6_ZOSMR|nr:hypothetical protein ZOSMA_12G00130 [Zostera marina]
MNGLLRLWDLCRPNIYSENIKEQTIDVAWIIGCASVDRRGRYRKLRAPVCEP